MIDSDDIEGARRAYDKTANDPDVKRDRPPSRSEPGSHSTGGASDHRERGEGERHSSAPGMSRKQEPMVTRTNPATSPGRPGPDRNADTGLTPDNDT
jgi:hypothetical protein